MGEMADYYFDIGYGQMNDPMSEFHSYGRSRSYEKYVPPEPDYAIWTTKDDIEIPISEMSKQHLINSIKILKQGDYLYKNGYLEAMQEELDNRNPVQEALDDFTE